MRNYLTAKSHSLFSPKSSIVDVQLGSKYASDLRQVRYILYTLYVILPLYYARYNLLCTL